MVVLTHRRKFALGALLLAAACLTFYGASTFRFVAYAKENVTYYIDPTPARAFAYGERHFSASDVADYDIDRAEYFFKLAAVRDVSISYLFHELARVSFLRGNFDKALAQINLQISLHGESEPKAYYVRGLIEGYMGSYNASITDYKHFLKFDPHNWAAINDYCWVLLKANRPHDAAVASTNGLTLFPNNPWLLNTNAIALYESGEITAARTQARRALIATQSVTAAQWLVAYPGNDPRVADIGVAAFQNAARENMHSIVVAVTTGTVQSKQSLHE